MPSYQRLGVRIASVVENNAGTCDGAKLFDPRLNHCATCKEEA
jgi:hypothetical protein